MMNIWNFTKFHRYMVKSGFIRAQDFNLNILQGPQEYRIDMLPADIKQQFKQDFEAHIRWLEPRDGIQRATGGFRGAIEFMTATDNTHLIDTFWRKTHELDAIRKEQILDVIPELEALA
jgi:hypothetical protein